MRACYPNQVDDDNPVSPVELFCRRPCLGQFSWPRWWQVSRGDTGATQEMTLGGYDLRWYGRGITGQASFVGAPPVHPNGITRPGTP